MFLPSDEVGGKTLLIKPPVFAVEGGANLHWDWPRGEAGLDDSASIYEDLASNYIDLHVIPHVWL